LDTSRNFDMQDVRSLSVWRFALKHGVFRLGGEAVLAIWLVILFRKTELTEMEFTVPLVVGPLICFLYAALVWFIKRR
jgi:hypothetical protein